MDRPVGIPAFVAIHGEGLPGPATRAPTHTAGQPRACKGRPASVGSCKSGPGTASSPRLANRLASGSPRALHPQVAVAAAPGPHTTQRSVRDGLLAREDLLALE